MAFADISGPRVTGAVLVPYARVADQKGDGADCGLAGQMRLMVSVFAGTRIGLLPARSVAASMIIVPHVF